jgi:dUTP pyrophosphatase
MFFKPKIYFAKLKPNAIIPSKDEENGAYDIYACFDEEEIMIKPNEVKEIPTGLISAFNKKYRFIFEERGSTGCIALGRKAGEIDSGFRGEWFVILNNTNKHPICISKKYKKTTHEDNGIIYYPYSKAIVQANFDKVPKSKVIEKSIDFIRSIPSKRGEGCKGDSGK